MKNISKYYFLIFSLVILVSLACSLPFKISNIFQFKEFTIQTEEENVDYLQEESVEMLEEEVPNELIEGENTTLELMSKPVITPENADQIIQIDRFGKGFVTDIAWSSTGEFLVIGTSTGICIYESGNLIEEKCFEIPLGISSVAFSPNGQLIASGSSDGTVVLLDVVTGKELYTIGVYPVKVESLAFSPDGRVLAFPVGKSIIFWDIENQVILMELVDEADISAMAISPDGNMLATIGHFENPINLWDLPTRAKMMTLQGHTNTVSKIFFTPDSQHLVSGSYDGTVRFWDTKTGEDLRIIDIEFVGALISFSPDGELLARAGSWDKTITIMDANTGTILRTLEGHTDNIYNLSFSPDNKHLVSISEDGTGRFWDINSNESLVVHEGYTRRIVSVSISQLGQILISDSKNVYFWSQGNELYDWSMNFEYFLWEGVLSPDGQLFALFFDWSGLISIGYTNGGEVFRALEMDAPYIVTNLAFSPDGSVLASSGYHAGDGGPGGPPPKIARVQLWDTNTWEKIITFDAQTYSVSSMAFSQDGSTLVLGGEDGYLEIWDLKTVTELEIFNTDTRGISSVIFSPDGLLLAVSDEENVSLRDVTDWSVMRTLQGHSDYVATLAFSPDGQMLASGSVDNTVRLWNIATGELLTTLEGHTQSVSNVAFSPEGNLLVSGSTDGTVRFWGIPQ